MEFHRVSTDCFKYNQEVSSVHVQRVRVDSVDVAASHSRPGQSKADHHTQDHWSDHADDAGEESVVAPLGGKRHVAILVGSVGFHCLKQKGRKRKTIQITEINRFLSIAKVFMKYEFNNSKALERDTFFLLLLLFN